MPFVANMDNEEQKTDPSLAPQGAVSPTGGGGAVRLPPSSAVPTAGGGGTAGAAPTPAAGGQFASLQNYLTANQGQAAPLAGKLTPGINQQYNNLDAANNAAIAGINQQVASGAAPTNAGTTVAQETANPVSFANNPGNVASFQSLLNASYTGPASAEGTANYANQQTAINNAIAQGQAQTTTEAGREQLLSQNEAAPTAGVTALNSAILSQDPNALKSIESAYTPFQNLLTNLQTGATATDQQIAQNQAQAAQDQQAAQQAITNQIGTLNTNVTGELTTAQQKAAAQNADVMAAFKNLYGGAPVNTAPTTLGTYGGGTTPWVNTTNYNVNAFTPQTAAELGMTSDQAAALQNALQQAATSQIMSGHNFAAGSGTTQVDLTPYLTQLNPANVINAANVATPQDYANAQAFQTLLQGMNFAAPTALINPSTAAQAGTAPTNLNTFDYQTALNQAQQTAAAERQAAQAEANALTSGADLAHAQSEHNHGFLGAVQNAITNPINTLTSVANPASWIPNAVNIVKGQNVSPTNVGQKLIKRAHGGVVETPLFKKILDKVSTGAK